MTLRLAPSWVWDFWFADDGERYHLFFLKASRALVDPDRRHLRASVGHAVSTDLVEWTELADALVTSDPPAFDDQATWTGSVVRRDDGGWRMFYTGASRGESGVVQRIGWADSDDLMVWRKDPRSGLEADPRWYEKHGDGRWFDEAWRDPWVFRDERTGGWRMLVTARSREGDAAGASVVGTATSPDLDSWTVGAPLSEPAGFGQIEVIQLEQVDGRRVMVFSCGGAFLSGPRAGDVGGVWAVNVDAPDGPFPIDRAYLVLEEHLYVGRLVRRRDGSWAMMAFRNLDDDGLFVGEIVDPMPVGWQGDRLVVLSDDQARPTAPH